MLELLTLERLGWIFIAICALGVVVNAAALFRPQWSRWTTWVDLALGLTLMAVVVWASLHSLN
ncbi:MAG: hypothetical protein M0D54_19725 [Hyphomonadaceae bacterium JAD_PAG50586_4]|nr:MAG: hypothetical protein M0D54_19725 [Hyphomonadaceae bacterium JAD_PAG50586_4]